MKEFGDIREDLGEIKGTLKGIDLRLARVEASVESNTKFRVKVIAWASTAAAGAGVLMPYLGKIVLAWMQGPRPH